MADSFLPSSVDLFGSMFRLVGRMRVIRQADAMKIIARSLPLHEMQTIDLVSVQAVPDICSMQRCR